MLGLTGALTVGKTALAASRFELTWNAAGVERGERGERGCIAEEELKRAMSTRLGRDPFVPPGQGEIVVDGRELPGVPGHLRARITQRDPEGRVLGTRDLEAKNCEELRRSVTFVVFLIVDPEAALGGSTRSAGPPDAKSDEPAPPSTEETPLQARKERPAADKHDQRPPATVVRRRRPELAAVPPPLEVDLGLALVASNGLLPKSDLGPALVLGVMPSTLPLRFEWRGVYRIPVGRVAGYDFRAVEQQWRGCYVRRAFGSIFGTACAGATWMAILPDARGLAKGDQAPKVIFSPILALGPSLEIGETRLFADLSLALPRQRYAFSYRDDGRTTPLHEVSRIVWSLGIGATRSFR
ncbi:hypothetical protein AKJ09_06915 [Labilithrix luteola]|uniref:Uncharacterized protein n=1 Tax=Labilithrix luteola TaxID=1391654 RepID=A0A0K1Q3P4_9BACT|nr:hypothetical protein AKJ09_06915 [Labilithrix luteola]